MQVSATAATLQVGKHQAHVFFIALVDLSHFRQAALSILAFVLEQVVFERFTTNNFAAAGCSKTLGSRAASFEFWHNFRLNRHNP